MLTAIKITKNHKALVFCKLEKLSKVNIICGRNNSGKSTLLEAIMKDEGVITGLRISEEQIKDIIQIWNNKAHQYRINLDGLDYTVYTLFSDKFDIVKVIRETIDQSNFWYGDELQEFYESFFKIAEREVNEITRDRNLTYQYRRKLLFFFTEPQRKLSFINNLSKIFEPELKTIFSSVVLGERILIPPKRIIKSPNNVITNDVVTGQGDYLIERLFEMKSRLAGSAERTFYDKLRDAFFYVTQEYYFDIALYGNEMQKLILYFSDFGGKRWIQEKDSGLGLQDLLVILYFALSEDYQLILIEEPENHLHPYWQRRLLEFLKLETTATKQFILSTHSNVFLDYLYADRVFFTSIVEEKLEIDDTTSKTKMLSALGYSPVDNLVSDIIIAVEGSGDKLALNEFFNRMGLLSKFNIRFWILNGDFMENVELEGLVEKSTVKVFLDNDPKSNRENFLEQCKQLQIPVTILSRYSLENYFPIEIYKESFQDKFPVNLTKFAEDKPVWSQIGNIKKSDLKMAARKFAARTQLSDLEGTDLFNFLKDVEKTLLNSRI